MKRLLLSVFALALLSVPVVAQTANANYPENNLAPNYAADTGAVNTLVATVNSCIAISTGEVIKVLPGHANTTTTPTLAYCGVAAKTITKCGQSAVAASDLTTTAVAVFVYDGTDMELQNPQASACGAGAGTMTDGVGVSTPGETAVSTGAQHVVGYNANIIWAAGGYPSTADGQSTAGIGYPTVLGVSDVTSQSASQSSVNLLASTPAAGHYLVRLYVDQNALCTTGTGSVYATVGWTDATHAHTAQTIPLTLANTSISAAAGYVDAAIPLWSAAASAITYTTTYGACTSGTGTYDLHAEVERTN
jgi:hypothetical protein